MADEFEDPVAEAPKPAEPQPQLPKVAAPACKAIKPDASVIYCSRDGRDFPARVSEVEDANTGLLTLVVNGRAPGDDAGMEFSAPQCKPFTEGAARPYWKFA